MTGTTRPDEAPVYVGRGLSRGVQLHFRQAAGFEELSESRARRLAFDLAALLGLSIHDPKLPGEVAE
ncbi:hypothetical protein [Streptomyces lydicus]|uniref:hypothetical protein n=1 Tax=Streptomyces lydicus TaxID=47763 RepID=UPI0036F0FB41